MRSLLHTLLESKLLQDTDIRDITLESLLRFLGIARPIAPSNCTRTRAELCAHGQVSEGNAVDDAARLHNAGVLVGSGSARNWHLTVLRSKISGRNWHLTVLRSKICLKKQSISWRWEVRGQKTTEFLTTRKSTKSNREDSSDESKVMFQIYHPSLDTAILMITKMHICALQRSLQSSCPFWGCTLAQPQLVWMELLQTLHKAPTCPEGGAWALAPPCLAKKNRSMQDEADDVFRSDLLPLEAKWARISAGRELRFTPDDCVVRSHGCCFLGECPCCSCLGFEEVQLSMS